MLFHTSERDDGNFELELDLEGIEYLEQGLADLRKTEIGGELSTPSFSEDAASHFILKRGPEGGELSAE